MGPLLLLLGVAAPPKAPWELTLDERLAARLDAGATSRRIAESARPDSEQAAKTATAGAAKGGRRDFVAGDRHPELLLPHELFDFLIGTTMDDDPTIREFWRDRFGARATELELGPAFWTELEFAAEPYLALRKRMRELSPHSDERANAEKNTPVGRLRQSLYDQRCPIRADALQAAEARFGKRRFAQFLYQAVAPDLQVESVDGFTEQQLRFVERGCR